MADLNQYNKARQEMIEARRQKAEGTIEPAAPTVYAKPQTVQKKLENFWYHYKWFVVAAVFLLVIVSISAAQMLGRTQYDVSIVIATQQPLQGLEEVFRPGLESIVDDYDQNGQKSVEIDAYQLGDAENAQMSTQLSQMNYEKLAARVSTRKDFIFILDDVGYDYLTGMGIEFEDLSAYSDSDNIKGDRCMLDGTKGGEMMNLEGTGDALYFCFVDFDTYTESLKNDELIVKAHENQEEYFKQLIAPAD